MIFWQFNLADVFGNPLPEKGHKLSGTADVFRAAGWISEAIHGVVVFFRIKERLVSDATTRASGQHDKQPREG